MKRLRSQLVSTFAAWVPVSLLGTLATGGCTGESTRVALVAQRRADEVQQAVFDQQHTALGTLLYRDPLRRLADAEVQLSPGLRAALNEVWNDRDLVELWTVQYERARALRIAGVDTKLYSDQSVVDLLVKAIEARADRVGAGLAAHAAEQAAPREKQTQGE